MTNQVIPEAAVEAGWVAYLASERDGLDRIRAILEAAAPHMLAPYLAAAWNEGHSVGRTDDWSLEPNPYRPTP